MKDDLLNTSSALILESTTSSEYDSSTATDYNKDTLQPRITSQHEVDETCIQQCFQIAIDGHDDDENFQEWKPIQIVKEGSKTNNNNTTTSLHALLQNWKPKVLPLS
jgi:hypothetical protein